MTRRAKLLACLLGSLMIAARTAPTDYLSGAVGVFSTGTFSGLISGAAGYVATGLCAANIFGDRLCFDNNGVQGGYPATDIAPQALTVIPQSAPPLGSANLRGGGLNLTGGWGTVSVATTDSLCSNGVDQYTLSYVTAAGVPSTAVCTASTSTTSATQFSCAGSTDQALSVELASCLGNAAGVVACGGTACTLAADGFVGLSGVTYVHMKTSGPSAISASLALTGGDMAAATAGVQGPALIGGGSLAYPGIGFARDNDGTGTGIINGGTAGTYLANYLTVVSNGLAVASLGLGTVTVRPTATSATLLSIGTAASEMIGLNSATNVLSLTGTLSSTGSATFTAVTAPIHILTQADLTSTCTLGSLSLDTGGAVMELCYCQATNTWKCAAMTAGPAD